MPYFYLGRELLFIDLKLDTHTKQLKSVQKAVKTFEYDVTFLTEVTIYQHFQQIA